MTEAATPFPDLVFSLQTTADGRQLMVLGGELDMHAAQILRAKLAGIEPSHANLAINLTGVPYIDSSGVGFLVELAKERATHGRVALLGAPPRVKKVLEMTGADRLFDYQEVDAGTR